MTLPHYDYYTDNMPVNVGGDARAFVNRYLPKYRDDVGIHRHEETHNAQWYAWLALGAVLAGVAYLVPQTSQYWPFPLLIGAVTHQLLYGNFSLLGIHYPGVARYRLWAEVAAYKVQLKANPPDWLPGVDCVALYAGFLAADYGLTLTPEAALNLLKS